MGRPIDYDQARQELENQFRLAENDFISQSPVNVPDDVASATNCFFESGTQSFREVLVGCCLARIVDPEIDIRLPYVNQGDRAYNGRTLDERVVNPFLFNMRCRVQKDRSCRLLGATSALFVRQRKVFATNEPSWRCCNSSKRSGFRIAIAPGTSFDFCSMPLLSSATNQTLHCRVLTG